MKTGDQCIVFGTMQGTIKKEYRSTECGTAEWLVLWYHNGVRYRARVAKRDVEPIMEEDHAETP